MHSISTPVTSNQSGVHPRLADAVRRHLTAPAAGPVSAHARAAFEVLLAALGRRARPLVLDSGCGTGESTSVLATLHRDALVVGVDQSATRLRAQLDDATHGWREGALFLRTDVAQLWRLMAQAGMRVRHHYVLYPNPWPKSVHYLRRWPAHPAWPYLIQLGGALALRTNWRVYAEEWHAALALSGISASLGPLSPSAHALTPFERKYRASGHELWRVTAPLN
jgi:tRNA G46 methylase TrmB